MVLDAQHVATALRAALAQHPQVRALCVAYSGGLDSTVLLHACQQWLVQDLTAARHWTLCALHVNHGLHGEAAAWQRHCERQCERLAVPLVTQAVTVPVDTGLGPEAAARQARYAVFEQQLGRSQCLLLAHHQDDQAETLLLRLMRASGVHGLAAMPTLRPLGRGLLCRPLLEFSRQQLLEYAQRHQLQWIEDHSNQDLQLDRNRIRHTVLPALTARWPEAAAALQRSAALSQEAAQLNDELAALDLVNLQRLTPPRLQLRGLQSLSVIRQRNALRYWLLAMGSPGVGQELLQRIQGELLAGEQARTAQLQWRGWQLHRFHGALVLQAPLPPPGPALSGAWQAPAETAEALLLPGNGSLRWHANGRLRVRPGQVVQWRYRRPGESCRLAGRRCKPLKQVLQEAGVPPWLRSRLPLLLLDGELALVPGVGVCEGFASAADEQGWALQWRLGDWQVGENSFVEKGAFW